MGRRRKWERSGRVVKLLAVLANLSWCQCRGYPRGEVGVANQVAFSILCSGVDDVIRKRERIEDGMVAAVQGVRLDGTVKVRGGATSRKTALLVLFIRTSYFDHKYNTETKMKRMKGTQVSRQRYRAAP